MPQTRSKIYISGITLLEMACSGSGSGVWLFFRKAGKEQAECALCQLKLSNKQGSTTALSRHLKRKHPSEAASIEKRSTPLHTLPLQSFLRNQAQLDPNSKRHNEITTALCRMVFEDMQPVRFVEDSGFKLLLKTLEPRYVAPTRKTIRNVLIPKLYDTMADKLKKLINESTSTTFSITTDGWTSRNTQSYVTYTLHILAHDFTLQSFVLGTYVFEDRHTSQNLKRHLVEIFSRWGIIKRQTDQTSEVIADAGSDNCEQNVGLCMDEDNEEDVGADIVDDCSNGDVSEADEVYVPEELEGDPVNNHEEDLSGLNVIVTTHNASNISAAVRDSGLRHIRCFAHSINLAVQKAIKVLSAQLSYVRKIVSYFHRSNIGTSLLKKQQLKEGVHTPKRVILDVVTRWNSTHDMITRYLEIHTAIYAALSQLKLIHMVRHIDLEVLEAAARFLLPLKEVTSIMSTETSSSISLIRPLIHQLLQVSEPKPSLHDAPLIHQAKATLHHDLASRYTDIDIKLFLDECSFLDPRVKTLPYVSNQERDIVHDSVLLKMADIQEKNASNVFRLPSGHAMAEANMPDTTAKSNSANLGKLLGALYQDSVTSGNNSSSLSNLDIRTLELKQYITECLCSMNYSPLLW